MAQLSVQLLVSAQVMISVSGFEPCVGLHADSVEPAWDSLSLPPSLSVPPLIMVSLSLSLNLKINK